MAPPGHATVSERKGTPKQKQQAMGTLRGWGLALWLPPPSFWLPAPCPSHLPGRLERGSCTRRPQILQPHLCPYSDMGWGSGDVTSIPRGLPETDLKHLRAGNLSSLRLCPFEEVRILPTCATPESHRPAFKSQFYHLFLEPNFLMPVNCSSFTCKMGMIVPFAQTCEENSIG